jgi:hypothetical protein
MVSTGVAVVIRTSLVGETTTGAEAFRVMGSSAFAVEAVAADGEVGAAAWRPQAALSTVARIKAAGMSFCRYIHYLLEKSPGHMISAEIEQLGWRVL